MTLILYVKNDLRNAEKYLTDVQKKAVPKAAARSINRTATKVNKISVRVVADRIGLKQKYVKRGIGIDVKATRTRLYSAVTARGKPINLIEFLAPSKQKVGAFKKKKGVIAKPYGIQKTFVGTFIGRGQTSGKLLVLTRKQPKQSGRLPIKGKAGPSIPKTFVRKEIASVMKLEASRTWKKEFEHNMQFYLGEIK